jgi:hypothetical protein
VCRRSKLWMRLQSRASIAQSKRSRLKSLPLAARDARWERPSGREPRVGRARFAEKGTEVIKRVNYLRPICGFDLPQAPALAARARRAGFADERPGRARFLR